MIRDTPVNAAANRLKAAVTQNNQRVNTKSFAKITRWQLFLLRTRLSICQWFFFEKITWSKQTIC